jgi:hypothetical protein
MLKEIFALVFVAGTSTPDITRISQDFANRYYDRGDGVELSIYTSKTDDKKHVLKLEQPQEFYLFNFLVNFIAYPADKTYRLEPRGYWKLQPNQIPSSGLENDLLMIFVPLEDREYDNVYAITQTGNPMKLGFAIGEEYIPLNTQKYKFIEQSFNLAEYKKPVVIRSIPLFLQKKM